MLRSLLMGFGLMVCSMSLWSQAITEKPNYDSYQPGKQRYKFVNFGISYEGIFPRRSNTFSEVDLTVSGNSYFNSKRLQLDQSFSLGNSTDVGNFHGNYKIDVRAYLLDKYPKLHLSVGASLGGATNFNNYTSFATSSEAGLGLGRIEVLNELEISERLLKILGNQDEGHLFGLADKLSKIKNERLFTNRDPWKDDFEQLQQYLKTEGLANLTTTEDQLTALRYIFEKEPLIRRQQGELLTVSGFTGSSILSGFRIGNFAKSNGLLLRYQDYKYVDTKWQWNTSSYLSYVQATNTELRFIETGFPNDILNLGANTALHYLPNIDTRLSGKLGGLYAKGIDDDSFTGYQVTLGLEYEKRLTRNMKAAVGVDLGYHQRTGFSFMPSFKINF